MTTFCGNGSTLSQPWVDHGFAHCFLETCASSIIFGWMLLAGGFEIAIYRKYSTPMDAYFKPKSCLYKVQILAPLLIVLQNIVRIALEATVINDGKVHPYQIMGTVFYCAAWLLSLVVIRLERHRMLPSIPTQGHGLVLLIFWTLAFVGENLAFVSWFSPQWWWQNRR